MVPEKKSKVRVKTSCGVKGVKGSNWLALKSLILKNPVESRKRSCCLRA